MAVAPIFIKRKEEGVSNTSISFDSLLQEGIELSQTLSGHDWTDYNIHDPGVTILEQLCYVLSDIAYRCDYPVIDYLAGGDDKVSFDALSLHLPKDIFTRHPSTRSDLVKLLRNEVIAIESISIVEAKTNAVSTTLHDIYVNFDPIYLQLNNKQEQIEFVEKIQLCYENNRSLNENVNKIYLKEVQELCLSAEILVHSSHSASETCAAIYMNVLKKIASIQNTDDISKQKVKKISVSDLYSAIDGIEQVAGVKHIGFLDQHNQEIDELEFETVTSAISLHLPKSEKEIHVHLFAGNKRLPLYFGRFVSEYYQLASLYKKHKAQQFAEYQSGHIPVVFDRELAQYTSITQHFPSNYKLKPGQILASASNSEKAHNLQLKGYLAVFDQMLHKQTQSLAYIETLFAPVRSSIDEDGNINIGNLREEVKQLNAEQVAGFNEITGPDFTAQTFHLDNEHSQFEKRASKVLDYFLALYGEKMNQNSLSMLANAETQQVLNEIELENKIRMLQHIKAITKDRLKGVNLSSTDKSAAGLSGMQLKVSVLLGFTKLNIRQLYKLEKHETGMHLIEHGLLGQFIEKCDAEHINTPAVFYQHQVTVVFPDWTDLGANLEFRQLAQETVMLSCPAHIFAHVVFINKTTMRKLDSVLSPWLRSLTRAENDPSKHKPLAMEIARILLDVLPAYNGGDYALG